MKTKEEIKDFTYFIAEYASCLLGSGVHTSRVVRNSNRIANALGMQIRMTTFPNSIILTVSDQAGDNMYTEVVHPQHLPINFVYNAEMSSLSWEAIDNQLSLEAVKLRYNAIKAQPRINPNLLVLLVGLANASFCRLFGGDLLAVLVVFISTMVGFYLRLVLQKKGMNHFVVFTTAAFVTSVMASFSIYFDKTAEVAIATSVLYLIPGVPLINGVIDILEGHTLSGGSRLVQAFLLILCVAIGLSASLFIFQNSLL
jgi:uncharacterized membrane protein YjjP (DUF1212 family)